MKNSDRRPWNDEEKERLQSMFDVVWKEVSTRVSYEIRLDQVTDREAVFTVVDKNRVFARPQRYEKTRRGNTRTINGFGIYVEHKVPSSRKEPAHLDEYLHSEQRSPGGVAREIVTLPLQIIAGNIVEQEARKHQLKSIKG